MRWPGALRAGNGALDRHHCAKALARLAAPVPQPPCRLNSTTASVPGRFGVLGIPSTPILLEPRGRFILNPSQRLGFRCEFINMDLFAMRECNAHVPHWLRFHLDRIEFRLRLTHSLTMGIAGQSRYSELAAISDLISRFCYPQNGGYAQIALKNSA